ncbi:MAG: lipid-A-disaccharide synthase [Deltaproteobacteria bacterium]
MRAPKHTSVFIIAGEASGDMHAASFMQAMKNLRPNVVFHGIGGPAMKGAGLVPIFNSAELSVVGLVEVVSRAPAIFRAYRKTVAALRKLSPHLLVLVDFPEFNLIVARQAKRLKIPVFYYISPQVWAWRQGRVKKIRRLVDEMAVILPFEEDFYKSRGMAVNYVGHPLMDVVRATRKPGEFAREHGLDPGRAIVGLLPGSRAGEVSRILPVMLDAAGIMANRSPALQFILPVAPTLRVETLAPFLAGRPIRPLLVETDRYDAMAASDLLFLASGTVTLEAAILGIPAIVTYRVSPVTFFLGRRFIKVSHVSLVNLIAGREVVPEILQKDATPERLAREGLSLLKDQGRRDAMRDELCKVRDALGGPGAARRAAGLALRFLSCLNP